MMGSLLDIDDVVADNPLAARELADLRETIQLLTHKIITCGVAADHPDPNLSRREKDYGGKWDSPQAERVRKCRAERDRLLVLATKHCDKSHHDWQEILKIAGDCRAGRQGEKNRLKTG